MSPEALGGSIPPASDIYAFGMMLLAVFTGGRMASRDRDHNLTTVTDLVRTVSDATPSIPEDIPDQWRDMIERMTAADPNERPDPVEVDAWCRATIGDVSARDD